MKYYHIYIEYFAGDGKNAKKDDCYEKNIESLDRIKKYFAVPFLSGKTIFISGRVVRPGSVNIFRILESEKSLDELLDEKNASLPSGVLMWYSAENLLAGHFNGLIDITNEVMNEEQ